MYKVKYLSVQNGTANIGQPINDLEVSIQLTPTNKK